MPATRESDRTGGLRTVGASCVAVMPVPVVVSIIEFDALAASVMPGVEGVAPKGAGGIAAIGAGAFGGNGTDPLEDVGAGALGGNGTDPLEDVGGRALGGI